MVVVLAFIEFVNSFAAFKMVAAEDAGLLKLGQHPVDRGQADVGIVLEQVTKHVLGRHVPHRAALENLQDFQAGQCGLEAVVFEFVDLAHGVGVWWGLVANSGLVHSRQPLQCPDHIGMPSSMTASLTFRRFGLWLTALSLGVSLAACGGLSGAVHRDTFKPFVPEVVQGNFVSDEQRRALRPGMPRAQVRDILGTPLIASLFHAERWDYVFSIQRQGVAPQNFRLSVYFKGDVLEQVDSDTLPSESEFAGRLIARQPTTKPPSLQASEEALSRFAPARTAATAPTPTPVLPRQYPPLEPDNR